MDAMPSLLLPKRIRRTFLDRRWKFSRVFILIAFLAAITSYFALPKKIDKHIIILDANHDKTWRLDRHGRCPLEEWKEIQCASGNRSILITEDESRIADAKFVVIGFGYFWPMWAKVRKWNFTKAVQWHEQYSSNTTFVFWMYEAPLSNPDMQNQAVLDIFNLSWSFRDSDDIWRPAINIEIEDYIDALNEDYNIQSEFNRRENKVVFLASHCAIGRTDYVKAMQDAGYDVDAFGKCLYNMGEEKIPGGHFNLGGDICPQTNKYMFYIGLENQLAPDYITEKIFNSWRCGTIPIVFGENGVPDYSRWLPKGSYIDVSDFASVDDLVSHLNRIANDIELFSSYHKFRTQREETIRFWRNQTNVFPQTIDQQLCQMIEANPHPIFPFEASKTAILRYIPQDKPSPYFEK